MTIPAEFLAKKIDITLVELIPSLQELVVDRKQFATAKKQLPASIKIILEN